MSRRSKNSRRTGPVAAGGTGARRIHRTRRSRRPHQVAAALAAAGILLAGCAGAEPGDGEVNLDYWLWDANQLPGYQQCAQDFEAANEGINVRVSQYGWDDYWQKVTAGLVAGAGPDVLTGHLTRYPEYVTRGALLDLNELDATADIGADEFQEGLAELWVGPDGGQYGIPKDFDTIALFYNEAMLEEAGVDPAEFAELEWNPEDGGTFEELLARLTIDTNGVRGDEDGFDSSSIEVYGIGANGSGGFDGQTQWSWLAGATGWTYTNADVWGDHYNYDDPRFTDTINWLFSLVDKGYMPPFSIGGADPNPTQQLASGQAAISPNGSWMIGSYAALDGVDIGIAPIPSGPVGHPVSMYNGLADNINAQTEYPQESAQLVAYLGSDACQEIIGSETVVFPARPAGTEAAIEGFAEQGIDVTPFTDLVDNGYTVLFPVTNHGSQITSMVTPVMDSIYLRNADADVMVDMNSRINALFD